MPMPQMDQEFLWCGATFRRTGEIDGQHFPVIYVDVRGISAPDLIGKAGLMEVSEVDNFTLIEHCDKCGQELPRPRR